MDSNWKSSLDKLEIWLIRINYYYKIYSDSFRLKPHTKSVWIRLIFKLLDSKYISSKFNPNESEAF